MTKPSSSRPSPLPDEAERNRLLAEMAEQSTDMISRHLPGNWEFIYASPAVTHLLGYSVDEIIGMSAYELYHPSDVENFKRRAPSVRYERGLYTHTYRFRRKDGSYTWLESTSRSIRDETTGALREILVVSRDASQRINTEKENRRLARVLEKSSDLVLFVNSGGQIDYANAAARSMLHLPQLDQKRVALSDFFSAASHQQLTTQAMLEAARRGSWSGEARMVGPGGQLIPVALEMLAHRTLDKTVNYYSIMAKDMSAVKEAEFQMQKISHASRLIAIGELASGLAHELNQPMTAIVNYARGIERRLDQDSLNTEDLQQPLQSIVRTARRASEIVRKTMDFSRRHDPQREALHLPDVIRELVQFCSTLTNNDHIDISLSLPDDLPPAYADRIQIEQVLLNLIMNAIEAIQRDTASSKTGKIHIDAAPHGDQQIRISVLDNGAGIPASSQIAIFEQFFTTKTDGLGMGLTISRSLIEAHGGQIQVESVPGAGARFSFTLEQAIEPVPDDQDDQYG